MVEININHLNDYKEAISKEAPYYNSSLNWTCKECGEVHYETEVRNLFRRKILCSCQNRKQQALNMNNNLKDCQYEFLYLEENAYVLTKSKSIDTKKPILVKCLNCGKISYEYYQNIRTNHKKCNCNTAKKFTRNLTTSDFLKKWHPINQQNFLLCEGEEYTNRNSKYKIQCKRCKHTDIRWGISLIDGPIACKYCETESLGESMIDNILNKMKVNYIREYQIYYNQHQHRFDFFLPEYNICIEYNGLQHYKPISYFGGEEEFERRQERDLEKQAFCKEHNYKLIIFSSEKDKYKDIEKKLGEMLNDYPEKEYTISD